MSWSEVEGDIPEWVYCCRDTIARLTDYVRLKATCEYLVNDTLTILLMLIPHSIVIAVTMEDVQGGYEELVGILLLVAGKMASMSPYQVKQFIRYVRSGLARVEFLEYGGHFAYEACRRLGLGADVPVSKEVVSEQRSVR